MSELNEGSSASAGDRVEQLQLCAVECDIGRTVALKTVGGGLKE